METDKKSNFLAISILAAALIIGGSILYSSNGGSVVNNEPAGKLATIDINSNNLSIDDDVILGDPNAPVTIIEFGDYQCPFCKKFFEETEGLIRENYIKTGKARMVYRDFPLDSIHPFARPAALAAECARDQGKYWAYHDALFATNLNLQNLDYAKLAGEIALNLDQFKQCYSSKKYSKEIEKDYQDGIAAGVNGTPATFINGKLLSGALPYEAFKDAIEEALASLK